jgi:hypothetical protein
MDEQPPIAIDPGPYQAVHVCWAGRCVTVLTSGEAGGSADHDETPTIVHPQQVGLPVVSRFREDEGPGFEAPLFELPLDLATDVASGVLDDNPFAVRVAIRGNLVALDELGDLLAASRQVGQPLVIRLVEA